ncbi:MAG: hypothetical protein Q8O24_04220 [Gallionellaceae bacterium]|nr:hypothetical protein [Gallionellaceae bacterium]
MKKKIVLACLCGVAVLASQSAMASSLKVRGGVTNNSYTLDITPTPTAGNPYAESSYSGNSLGLTWLADDSSIYLDYAASSGSGDWTGKYTSGTTFTSAFTRADNAIVLGTNTITSGGSASSFYVGWKNGESNLTRAPGAVTNPSLIFKTSGLIFGGGLGIPAAGGTIGLSLGMGIMNGQYDNIAKATITSTVYTTTSSQADNAIGFSYGIGYTYSFTPNIGVTVDYKGNAYKYTFDSGLSSEWSLNESFTTTGATLFVKF